MKSGSGLLRCVALLSLFASACALSGCGQQGPLYLPDAQMPHGKAAKRAKGAPALPPNKGAAASDTGSTSNGSTAIVPVTPSIPD